MARFTKLQIDSGGQIAGKHQLRVVHIDQSRGRRQLFAFLQKISHGPDWSDLRPRFHALMQEPHTIYVSEKADGPADAAEVREIHLARFLVDARLPKHRAHERPGPGTDKRPV